MGIFVRESANAEDDLGDELLDFMSALGGVIQENAERIVPVDTMALQRDLHHEETREGALVSTQVGSDLDYSTAVELGRRDLPAYPVQPYLKPAMLQARGVNPL